MTQKQAEDQKENQQIALMIAERINDDQIDIFSNWLSGLLEIRGMDLSVAKKAKLAIKHTYDMKIIMPSLKLMAQEISPLAAKIKQIGWTERGLRGRFALVGTGIGALLFGGQSAGIAALGSAIGIPLWIVIGGGASMCGEALDVLQAKKAKRPGYTVIDLELKK